MVASVAVQIRSCNPGARPHFLCARRRNLEDINWRINEFYPVIQVVDECLFPPPLPPSTHPFSVPSYFFSTLYPFSFFASLKCKFLNKVDQKNVHRRRRFLMRSPPTPPIGPPTSSATCLLSLSLSFLCS